jgi:hypothetical protein
MTTHTAPLSDLLARLRTGGDKLPSKVFEAIREHGQEAVAPLIEIVREYPGDDADAPAHKFWATHHAIQLLGDLRAAEAVGPILDLLDEDDDYVDQHLPESLAKIGRPALAPLRTALFAPDADLYGVARAGNALVKMAELHPELRPEIVTMMVERFDADVPNDEPEALRGFLVSDLADLRAVEAIPIVRHAYGKNLVDETIIGLEHFRQIVERPEGTHPHDAMKTVLESSHPKSLFGPGFPALPRLPFLLDEDETEPRPPLTFGRKVGRNQPCPCGSGKKFKRCCGR